MVIISVDTNILIRHQMKLIYMESVQVSHVCVNLQYLKYIYTIHKGSISHLSMNDNTIDLVPRRTFLSTDRHTTVTIEMLATKFIIGHM